MLGVSINESYTQNCKVKKDKVNKNKCSHISAQKANLYLRGQIFLKMVKTFFYWKIYNFSEFLFCFPPLWLSMKVVKLSTFVLPSQQIHIYQGLHQRAKFLKHKNICKLEWRLKMIISRLVNMNVYLDLDIHTPNQVLYIGFFLWCVCGVAGIFGMVTVAFLKSDCR